MKRVNMKIFKKIGALALITTILVSPMATTTYASSPIIVSEEGIGINVYNPRDLGIGQDNSILNTITGDIDGDKVSVAGGLLWATWRGGSVFRANYDHSTKEHRCTAMNDNGYFERSRWEDPGTTAISPWIYQTFFGNKAFADTRE